MVLLHVTTRAQNNDKAFWFVNDPLKYQPGFQDIFYHSQFSFIWFQ
jgi:hypothetical protein